MGAVLTMHMNYCNNKYYNPAVHAPRVIVSSQLANGTSCSNRCSYMFEMHFSHSNSVSQDLELALHMLLLL